MTGMLEDFDRVIRRERDRAILAEERRLFKEFYARIGRALYAHHRATGVPLRPGDWKIFVSAEMDAALKVFARHLEQPSTALEVVVNGARLGGFDLYVDPALEGDDVRLRAEIVA